MWYKKIYAFKWYSKWHAIKISFYNYPLQDFNNSGIA